MFETLLYGFKVQRKQVLLLFLGTYFKINKLVNCDTPKSLFLSGSETWLK